MGYVDAHPAPDGWTLVLPGDPSTYDGRRAFDALPTGWRSTIILAGAFRTVEDAIRVRAGADSLAVQGANTRYRFGVYTLVEGVLRLRHRIQYGMVVTGERWPDEVVPEGLPLAFSDVRSEVRNGVRYYLE